MLRIIHFLLCLPVACFSQGRLPHANAHAHNDYEHARPLLDALKNGFISVEADVHVRKGELVVAHNSPSRSSRSLESLYLAPLDSILAANEGRVYRNAETFYLMIDLKTGANETLAAIKTLLAKYPSLKCMERCPVKIFLSGNRPSGVLNQPYDGTALDGRPSDVGKGYSAQQMPVISDHYKNWSSWNGKSEPNEKDFERIRSLAKSVHAEGKKLRLWAIPDNSKAWDALLKAGVDMINTDHLEELNRFLSKHHPLPPP